MSKLCLNGGSSYYTVPQNVSLNAHILPWEICCHTHTHTHCPVPGTLCKEQTRKSGKTEGERVKKHPNFLSRTNESVKFVHGPAVGWGFPFPLPVCVFQTNRNDFLCHVFDALNGKGTGSISMIQKKKPQTHVKKGLRFRVRETVQCVNMYDMRWSDLFAATMRICGTLTSATERPELWTTFLLPRVKACVGGYDDLCSRGPCGNGPIYYERSAKRRIRGSDGISDPAGCPYGAKRVGY